MPVSWKGIARTWLQLDTQRHTDPEGTACVMLYVVNASGLLVLGARVCLSVSVFAIDQIACRADMDADRPRVMQADLCLCVVCFE